LIPEIDTAAEIDLILMQDGSKGPYLHWKEHIHGGAHGERSSFETWADHCMFYRSVWAWDSGYQCTWNVHTQYFIASLVPRPPPPGFVIIMQYTACIT